MSFGIFVTFQKKLNLCVSFQFHIDVNMLRLFQEINMFFFFEIKPIFKKKLFLYT
jgi:hypothetical protein